MKFNFSEAFYRVVLFIALYLSSILMLYLFFYLDGSAELKETLQKIDNHSTATGFTFYALVGIFQYGLLIIGISIFGTLTYLLIRKINILPILIISTSFLLFSCYSRKYALKYPDLKIEGKKSNKYILDRITNYGNGYQNGCLIVGQISLNIDKLSNDSIAGFVFDSNSKEPLYFSTINLIYINETHIDTIVVNANEKGSFTASIKNIPDKVAIKHIGYRTLNIALAGDKR